MCFGRCPGGPGFLCWTGPYHRTESHIMPHTVPPRPKRPSPVPPPRRSDRTASLAGSALAAVLLTGCATGPERSTADGPGNADTVSAVTDSAPAPGAGIEWRDCTEAELLPPPLEGEERPEVEIPEEMRCSEVAIPVDHDAPGGRTTSLQVAILPHTGEGESRGAVLYVAGGPASPGIPDLPQELETVAELREHFDFVAWNPRGVMGETAEFLPADVCGDQGPGYVDVATEEEFDAVMAEHRAVMEECRDRDPEMFDSMDTFQHVGDMESIRVALGEERLNLYAQSHGGVRATAYADLYPERLESVVLDSVVDNVSDPELREIAFTTAMETRFQDFARWCADSEECALHGQDVTERWQELLTGAAEEPLPADGIAYGRAELSLMGGNLVRNAFSWPLFSEAIESALENGDSTRFHETVGASFYTPNVVAADICADGGPIEDFAGYQEYTELTVGLSENLGHGRALHRLPCAAWPHEGVNPPGPIGTEGLPPFLILASELEFSYAAAMTGEIPGSVAVEVEGTGHGLYFFESGDCVVGHVHRYFVDGVLPEEQAFCATD